jgi:transcriptional regulator with XRE-family HTH domain
MPSEEELAAQRRRRAWWIASARRADPRKPKLVEVAEAVGLKANSASTVSDWENNIGGGPSVAQLHRLAAFYGLAVAVFMEPAPTEQEHLDQLRALASDAVDLEQLDSETAESPGPASGVAPAVPPRRRTA